MPRPVLPLTPASSSEIKGQDGTHQLASSVPLAFELPPPAVHDASRISPIDLRHPSPSSLSGDNARFAGSYPVQAAETVKSRQRSSTANVTARGAIFALPPPPTRSRKIIQVKPRAPEACSKDSGVKETRKTSGKRVQSGHGGAKIKLEDPAGDAAGKGKKRLAHASTVAGRKIARKTAHSLIERRRRSKMNEEFAVLKDLIPACSGEMHKLAILQASIEYVRYLQDCLEKLNTQHEDHPTHPRSTNLLPSIRDFHPTAFSSEHAETTDHSEAISPTFAPQSSLFHQPSVSPAQDCRYEQHQQRSYSSASTDQPQHYNYSYSHSTSASPAFGPMGSSGSLVMAPDANPRSRHQRSGVFSATLASTWTSPTLGPEDDMDHEATAALLMLNSDRRPVGVGARIEDEGRGLSVKQLLSN